MLSRGWWAIWNTVSYRSAIDRVFMQSQDIHDHHLRLHRSDNSESLLSYPLPTWSSVCRHLDSHTRLTFTSISKEAKEYLYFIFNCSKIKGKRLPDKDKRIIENFLTMNKIIMENLCSLFACTYSYKYRISLSNKSNTIYTLYYITRT